MTHKIHLLLADDDDDDRMFFKKAMDELPLECELTTVNDGQEVMDLLLNKTSPLPDLLFLDLNMPRKNGFECLSEIRQTDKLKKIPVIIFSTSQHQEVVDFLYNNGAMYYVRKPKTFDELKDLLHKTILLATKRDADSLPGKEEFVVTLENEKQLS